MCAHPQQLPGYSPAPLGSGSQQIPYILLLVYFVAEGGARVFALFSPPDNVLLGCGGISGASLGLGWVRYVKLLWQNIQTEKRPSCFIPLFVE